MKQNIEHHSLGIFQLLSINIFLKTGLIIFILFFVLSSCSRKAEGVSARISGHIQSYSEPEIKISGVLTNPIINRAQSFSSVVDSAGHFDIQMPISRLVTGYITYGSIKYSLCIKPGDDVFVEIKQGEMLFSGKGAAKNTFLAELQTQGLSDRRFNQIIRHSGLSPDSILLALNNFRDKRLKILADYHKKEKLSEDFRQFFIVDTQIRYENLIRVYFSRRKDISDTSDFYQAYLAASDWSRIIDDNRLKSLSYISYLSSAIRLQSNALCKQDTSLNYQEARKIIIQDSISGRAGEYLVASQIYNNLCFNNYDSASFAQFNKMALDTVSKNTVRNAFDKYQERLGLIGQPLHREFRETQLADTANNIISFGEMMDAMKGRVVYLDIWSLNCGPCRAAKPHELKLKNRLADLPIEFVDIIMEDDSKDLWEKVFQITKTSSNHYRTQKTRGSSRLEVFMVMYYVPAYMIFDKKGRLVDYNADRPFVEEGKISELEKRLRKLVEE